MIKRWLGAAAFGLASLAGLVVFSGVAQAASPAGLTLTPALQNIDLHASEAQKIIMVSLTNHTSTAMNLVVSTVDFGALEDTGGLVFVGSNSDFEKKYGLAAWLTLEKNQLTIEPGATEQVKATVVNRDSLSPGGHYAAILFKKLGIDAKTGNPVRVDQVAANLIFLRKIGGEHFGLELSRLQPQFSWLGAPTAVDLRFHNTGNVHMVPRGQVLIYDPRGKLMWKGIVNTGSGLILPEVFRLYPTSLFKVANSWLPGRYRVLVQYRYEGADVIHNASTSFFYVDWLVVLLLLAILAVAAWLGFRLVRGPKKPKSSKKP